MKKTLVSCAAMFLFAVTMLLGTTYAWWSETITVDENIIQMGNLDLKAELSDPDEGTGTSAIWYDLQQYTTTGVWETRKVIQPGDTDTRLVRLTNTGSIALDYKITTDVDMNNPLRPYILFSAQGQLNLTTPMVDATTPWVTLQPGQSHTFTVSYHVLETLGDVDGSFGEGLTLPFTFTIQVEQATRQ